jgi:hypothetical protein
MKQRQNLIASFILVAIWFRLIPHLPNFTPVTSLALFSGVLLQRKWLGMIIPLVAMIISDMVIGFHPISIWVYLGITLITMSGWFTNRINVKSILISSLIFFIVSNFGVWVLGYPHTFDGLVLCYTLAIPFFGYSILGDLFWGFLFRESYKLIEKRVLNLA